MNRITCIPTYLSVYICIVFDRFCSLIIGVFSLCMTRTLCSDGLGLRIYVVDVRTMPIYVEYVLK